MDDLAHLGVVVALGELVVNLKLHRVGFFAGHVHRSARNVLHAQRLLGVRVQQRFACLLVTGHLPITRHAHHVRLRRGLDAPIAVVCWQQDVSQARFACVGLLPGQADVDG